jgi:hypothetical protein
MQTPGSGREESRGRGNSKMPVGEGHEAFLSKGVAVFGMDRTEALMQHKSRRGEDGTDGTDGTNGTMAQMADVQAASRLAGCSRNPAFAGPITRRGTRHSLDFCCTSYPDAAT